MTEGRRDGTTTYELEGVRFAYPRAKKEAVSGITLSFPSGRHVCVVGPNGAGKSTLLRLMLGILAPRAGRLFLWGRELGRWGRRELARRVGVVSQDRPPDFPLTVREFVEMGRHPYLRPWKRLVEADREAVDRALGRTGLTELADREISTLSGGELQRAKLARALAQEPSLLLLDEPTVHLDLGHEIQFFELVNRLVEREGLSSITVTHNLHLASRYADHLVLLAAGGVVAAGPPADVLTPDHLGRLFGCPVTVVDMGDLGLQVVPRSSEATGWGSVG